MYITHNDVQCIYKCRPTAVIVGLFICPYDHEIDSVCVLISIWIEPKWAVKLIKQP